MSCCNVILNPVVSDYALSFDGTNDKVVATDYKGVVGQSARSFSWWMKVDTFSGIKSVVGYGGSGFGLGWHIYINNGDNNSIDLDIGTTIKSWNGTNNSDLIDLDNNTYNHFVMTAPAAGTLGAVKLYMNGKLQNIGNYAGSYYTNIYNTSVEENDLQLGERFLDSGLDLAAKIDEFALFHCELTAEEISAIYNDGDGLELTINNGAYNSAAKLELYYKFEEGSGSTAADSSIYGRDGAITGAVYVAR